MYTFEKHCTVYADDTLILRVVRNRNALSAVNDMNSDLLAIQRWYKQWLVEVSTVKSGTTFISRKVNPTDYIGERKTQIILSQMRVHFCDLNSHLFDKLCVESPMCSCEVEIESLMRFFNSCANYNTQRIKFRAEIHAVFANIPTPTLEHILQGDQNMNTESNEKLCKTIHSYIKDTNRFQSSIDISLLDGFCFS